MGWELYVLNFKFNAHQCDWILCSHCKIMSQVLSFTTFLHKLQRFCELGRATSNPPANSSLFTVTMTTWNLKAKQRTVQSTEDRISRRLTSVCLACAAWLVCRFEIAFLCLHRSNKHPFITCTVVSNSSFTGYLESPLQVGTFIDIGSTFTLENSAIKMVNNLRSAYNIGFFTRGKAELATGYYDTDWQNQ